MGRSVELQNKAMENSRALVKDDSAPDYLRALAAICLLEGNGWASEVAKLLGWPLERASSALRQAGEAGYLDLDEEKPGREDF